MCVPLEQSSHSGFCLTEKKRQLRVAVSAIRFTLPSQQLHKSTEGMTIARQRTAENRRKNSVAPLESGRRSQGTVSLSEDTLRKAESKGLRFDQDGDEMDEIQRMKQLEVIRQMPVPFATKLKLR